MTTNASKMGGGWRGGFCIHHTLLSEHCHDCADDRTKEEVARAIRRIESGDYEEVEIDKADD